MTGQQLKNSILQMAVQGKLVPQDPNDEPASVLLERIRNEKEQLIKEGKIKKEKNPSVIFRGADNLPYEKVGKKEPVCIADEVPFEIPESWEWVRLGSIVSVFGGKRIPAGRRLTTENTNHVYIRVSDMKDGYVSTQNLQYVPEDIFPKISKYIINKEDIFITVAGTIGRVGKIPPELDGANLTENADRLVFSNLSQDWLILELQSQLIQSQITDATTKVGQPKLAIVRIEKLLMPLPPIEEQKRIVMKFKMLSPSIEHYDSIQHVLYKLNSTFPDSLKKSILQEAIQGKLVPQDENDEPASVLLKRIRAEKEQLVKEGKLKRDKHESVIFRRDNSHYEKLDGVEWCIDDEIPFEIPESWTWTSVGEVCSNIQYGSSQKSSPSGKIAVLRMGNLQNGRIILDKLVYTSDPKEIEKYPLEYNDLLFNRTNSKELVGKVAIYKNEIPAIYAGYLVRLHPILIDGDYLNYVMQSQYYWIYCQNVRSDAIGQSNINAEKLKRFVFPLPPLQEQRRIVAVISRIMDKIENL